VTRDPYTLHHMFSDTPSHQFNGLDRIRMIPIGIVGYKPQNFLPIIYLDGSFQRIQQFSNSETNNPDFLGPTMHEMVINHLCIYSLGDHVEPMMIL
jgi:hypothetical protein